MQNILFSNYIIHKDKIIKIQKNIRGKQKDF